jgi:hypothetical protein
LTRIGRAEVGVDQAEFPTPIASLAQGKVWQAGDIESWIKTCRTSTAVALSPADAASGHTGSLRQTERLLVEELLSDDVCVATVLGDLAQHVEVHPPQRERAAPVPVKDVVQTQR